MSDVLYDLHATHTRTSPVFVIGYARSGTSLICRLMRRYLKISFGTESQFILRYEQALPGYGDLSEDANLRRLFDDIATERFFIRCRNNWGFVFDVDRAVASVTHRSYAGVLEAICLQLAAHNGMSRWGDKTPRYSDNLDALLALFPDAQFVHIVRDGRDVSLSIRAVGFGPKNACECAEQWSDVIGKIRQFGARLPPGQYHEVRYEHLTASPLPSLQTLAAFLNLDASDEHWQEVSRRLAGEVRADNTGKWRRAMSKGELRRFEGVAGAALHNYGYPLALDGTARRVSRSERLLWRIHGRAMRMSSPDHWRDSTYKLRLRAAAGARWWHVPGPRHA
jgi:hypothetical protein